MRKARTWDLVYNAGELVEVALAFYAQDKDGTVWFMGEYPQLGPEALVEVCFLGCITLIWTLG